MAPDVEAKGEAGSAGMRTGVPAAARLSARTMMRRASSILKALSPDGFASASAREAASWKASTVGATFLSTSSPARARQGFAATPPSAGRPGFGGAPAARKPRLSDLAVLDPQRSRSRDDGKRVGRSIADLEIARMRGKAARSGRQTHRHDEITRFKRRFTLRRISGQAMQFVERDLAPPI